MKTFDLILLNTSIIITPVILYLLYTAYIKIQDKKEEKLIFTMIILLQTYLIYKYASPISKNYPLLIIDIPLLITYYKKEKTLALLISIINISYYSLYIENNYLIIIAEYIIYFILMSLEKSKKKYIYFWTVKILFSSYFYNINIDLIREIILLISLSAVILYLLYKSEEIINIHSKLKKIEKEKQLQESLFQITHEIKNPIAVCKGYLDMYDENNIQKTKEYIPIIKEEIERVLILLEDFLSLKKQKINKEIIDINFLLEEVVNNMNILFKSKKIKLESIITDEEIFINADYNRLTQVLINILKNSIEALENKKNKEIKIWTEIEKNNINIHVKDNGEGIEKEKIKKIKEPFYTTKIKGTGLGVSLSNEIIKAHKGKMKYISQPSKYTEVIITLPLEKAI